MNRVSYTSTPHKIQHVIAGEWRCDTFPRAEIMGCVRLISSDCQPGARVILLSWTVTELWYDVLKPFEASAIRMNHSRATLLPVLIGPALGPPQGSFHLPRFGPSSDALYLVWSARV